MIAVLAATGLRYLPVSAQTSKESLIVAEQGAAPATIIVAPAAGTEIERNVDGRLLKAVQRPWERRAADDLQKYMKLMTGVHTPIAATPDSIATALRSKAPLFILGEEALRLEPKLKSSLQNVEKKDATLRADAIVLRRSGNRVYLAGSNDDSNYFAVAQLLQKWGCRWYMPTEFGECIPERKSLTVGPLDLAYAPPFEVRTYWMSWMGDISGYFDFTRRNMMNEERVPHGHIIGEYVKDIIPPGKTNMEISFSDPKTVAHVATKVERMFARGENFSAGMEDGMYQSNDPVEEELKAGLYDKYFRRPSMTEPFWKFYNDLAGSLQAKYPESNSRIGFLAYSNLTLPPMRGGAAAKPLVAYLAPIDIDPNHGMDDPNSPPRQEYRAMMYRWAQKMERRLVIYDYDQGNLVWRDLPNPSQDFFAQDVKHYREAGILGVSTESRGAFATIFLNLYFRGQLMWNPDADVDSLLREFYPNFYGPAARPMERYWNAIFTAWKRNITTEHEFMIAPAVYTPALVQSLRKNLEAAEALVSPLRSRASLSRNEKLYLDRLRFTRLSFEIISNYSAMVQAAAAGCDYGAAVDFGEKGLRARSELTSMNPIFTSTKLEGGYAFWEGEVKQYRELRDLTGGSKGLMVAKTPLEWSFRRDPNDTGLALGYAYNPVDLSYWQRNKNRYNLQSLKDYPTTRWEVLRTDLYAQAQGIRHPDAQSFSGYMWYRAPLSVGLDQSRAKLHLMFPGLFNEAWLYVNGELVAHRPFAELYWASDYKFEWDVDVSPFLKPGVNDIALRLFNPQHCGGVFRRPFLYRSVS